MPAHFQAQKCRIVVPGLTSAQRQSRSPHTAFSVLDFKRQQRRKNYPPPPCLLDILAKNLFSLLESEVRTGWYLVVPGQLQDNCDGAIRTIAKDELADAFRCWID